MMLSGLKRIRIIHRLRVAIALLGFLAVLTAVGGLWWANHTGLPEAWRTKIEEALSARGLHADVASLRYRPLRGIEAGEIVIYADSSRHRVVARMHELLLDVDRTRLSRGEVEIDRIDLAGARISLAADPMIPDSETLEITQAEGRIQMSKGRQVEIKNASGMVGGVRLEFDGLIKRYLPRPHPTPDEIELARAQRRKLFNTIIEALEKWGPESSKPPVIRIKASGDLEEPSTMRATIEVQGTGLKTHALIINSLNIQAELRGSTIAVHEADLRTQNGHLLGRLEFDTWRRTGSFEMNSSLDITALLQSLDLPLPERMPDLGKAPSIGASGTFAEVDDQWKLKLMGQFDLTEPHFEHLSADRVASAFSWDGSQLFLDDLRIEDGKQALDGRVFVTPEKVLYEAKTDLPPSFWQNAVRIQPLGTILNTFTATPDTTVAIDFRGSAVPGDKHAWTFEGNAAATNISYRGVPANRARVTLDLSHERLDFIDGEVEFDYRDYPLRIAHGGPATGDISVDLIRYDREPGTVTIRKLTGAAWPGPIVRTFLPSLAENLEKYGFHSNPGLKADGVIGVKHGIPKTDLTVRFATRKNADYEFLGALLEAEAPQGTVRVLPEKVEISDLSFGLFGGLVRGTLASRTQGESRVSGELDWTRISLPGLAKAYEFESQPKGQVTGRLDFTLLGQNVSGLSGAGHIALENGELFEVPIFGPLSTVISAVLGRRQAGFQEANEAFCTFSLEKGILNTLDFRTATSSIVLTGDAIVDLGKKTMQMTVRMNARGLFGVITLPLRPLYGFFQFRGIGPIEEPEWTKVMFTKAPAQQEETLLEPPKALRINPVKKN
ncbi:AsmA-like C-terminal region-containing protein [Haloferula sp.]|uniref:AsmA-like C-terminal region-containing protein n=1 Tax=Haloferula sp. TaxID=2497595 RepID=UPI003C77A24F